MKTAMRSMVLALGLWALASDARADGYASPFAGVVFGGSAGGTFNQAVEDGHRATYGFDLGGMSAGVFGAELDLGYTKRFFGTGAGISDSSVMTVMPTAIIGIPIGGQRGPGFRPYATAGLGLIRRTVNAGNQSIFDGNNLGYSLGFGAMGFFATHVGVRADYRYFRNVQVDDISFGNLDIQRGSFNFSRASVGAVFRF